jgi:hypothetical protein
MVRLADASHTIPVADRSEPRPWSPGPVFAALERALDVEDLAWVKDDDLRRALRRGRRKVVTSCVQELRVGAREAMNQWRNHAAARSDYSGPDPLLQMLALQTLLLALEVTATWTLTWGMPGFSWGAFAATGRLRAAFALKDSPLAA